MGILCLFLILISIMAFFYGRNNAQQIDFLIEIKNFSNPYYRIGFLFESIEREDDIIQEEYSIGLFFINFVVIFYK